MSNEGPRNPLGELQRKVQELLKDPQVQASVRQMMAAQPPPQSAPGAPAKPTPTPDAETAEARRALASGAELFIGGHGGAAGADAVRFKIDYLECVKRLLAANGTADEFARALRAAYPELPGEAGLDALAQALYADR